MSTFRSRAEQRDHLMILLGFLADPIRRLHGDVEARRPTIPYLESQFETDYQQFENELRSFCTVGQHFFKFEYKNVIASARSLGDFIRLCRNPEQSIESVTRKFGDRLASVQKAIRAIPCDDPGTILPPASPLQAYVRLRAICAGAGTRLDMLDPYLTADVFHLYLADVAQTATLTVVTSNKVMQGNDTMRRDRIVAVSELVARERPKMYRFLVSNQQHDRHCRADDTILHLGGSVAHASFAAPYTISTLDPSQKNHSDLDGVIAGADEWFGPTSTKHRTS